MADKRHPSITIACTSLPDRILYLSRWIRYHSAIPNCKLIVVSPALPRDIEADMHTYPHLQHICVSSEETLDQKLLRLVNEVNTRYVAWVPDDDFISQPFVKHSISLMNADLDCQACGGYQIFFDENSKEIICDEYTSPQVTLAPMIIRFCRKIVPKKYWHDCELLIHAILFNPTLLHSIIRVDAFKLLIQCMASSSLPIKMRDNLGMSVLLASGRTEYIPEVAGYRSKGLRIAINTSLDSHIPKDSLRSFPYYSRAIHELGLIGLSPKSSSIALSAYLFISSLTRLSSIVTSGIIAPGNQYKKQALIADSGSWDTIRKLF